MFKSFFPNVFSKTDGSSFLPPSVFGDYDIRGRYPQEVNEDFFRGLAAVIFESLRPVKIAIGRDSRQSSLSLTLALIESFRRYGIEVVDLGLITSPYGAWVAHSRRVHALVVTASHNPAGDNGLKIYSPGGEPLAGPELRSLGATLRSLPAKPQSPELSGSLKSGDFIGQYQRYLLRIVGSLPPKARVAIDYLHGTAGRVLTGILTQKRIKLTTIREDPSGEFPPAGPNPLASGNQKELSFLMKKGRYNLGAIFDADADRVVFLDETGSAITPAQTASLFCEYFFSKKGARRVAVVPVNFSRVINDVAQKKRGRLYRSPVGRVNLTPLMRAHRAVFGAELSGHYFFKDFFYEDSAVLALLYLLKILGAHKSAKLSELVAPYKKYATLPEENIPFAAGTEKEIFKAVRSAFPAGRVDRTDGLTIHYGDWWFNLRRSRTEPLWRLTVEAFDESLAHERLVKIRELVRIIKIHESN